MNWDAIGAVGELVSALAVVVTLVYLAVQVKQVQRAQQAESIRANRYERREFHTQLRDSPYMPAIMAKLRSGDLLNPEEESRLINHTAAQWGLVYSEWIQNELGSRGPYATSQEVNFSVLFDQPGSIRFLEDHGRSLYPNEFIAEVDSAFKKYQESRESRGT